MKKLVMTAAVLALGFAGSAHAATLITLGNAGSITYGPSATLTPNVNLATLSPSQLQLTGAAVIVNPALPNFAGQYTAPDAGIVFANNYLAVIASPQSPPFSPSSGSATYNLAPNQSSLGFTWGTVDNFNKLTLATTNGTYVISGSDIGTNTNTFGTDIDFVFNDSVGKILSATFDSTGNSFEVANFESFESAVPLPASLPMMVSALLLGGIAVYYRRRKTV